MSMLSSKLQPVEMEDDTFQGILADLQKPSTTIAEIALRTDLPNVLNIVKLQALAEWLRMEAQEPSAVLIEKWVKNYMDDMVSHQRKGRSEIVKAVQAVKDMAVDENRSRWTGKELEQ